MEEKKILTYEEIMALFMASEKRMAEHDKRMVQHDKEMSELREQQKRNEEKSEKELAELREQQKRNEEKSEKELAELRELQKATEKQMKENDEYLTKKLDRLNEVVNGVSNNIGNHAEQYFQDVFSRKKELGGEKYDKLIRNLKAESKESCEFDIFLVNGQSVAIIEVKNRIHPNFVETVANDKVSQFRKYFPEYKDYKLYLGIAGFSFDDSVIEEAKECGIGIIRQVGDAVEIDDKNLKAY